MGQNIYQKLGCADIINGCGYMTKLGTSIIDDSVAKSMYEASKNYVNINELYEVTSNIIKQALNVEDALIVNSAASGIVLACAGAIYKDNYLNIYQNKTINEIIIPKGHNINFGAPIELLMKMSGAEVVEVGWANECTREQIISKINENTKALVYIVSHHTVQKNMISLEDYIAIANEYNLPIIVDAAAEYDFTKYVELDPTLCIFSTAKAMNGPTGGIIFGKTKYINYIRKHFNGIGRAMKIGKESIIGVIAAFANYINLDYKKQNQEVLDTLVSLIERINNSEHLVCKLVEDNKRGIYRCQISLKIKDITKLKILNNKLQNSDPKIYLRDYLINDNILEIDIRTIRNTNELEIIYLKLIDYVKEIFDE